MKLLNKVALLFQKNFQILILYNNSPIIQLDNWNGIRKIVNDLLQDESLLMKKSEESLRWYENVMSEKATAMYVLSKIEQ